jgi:hypothetical protein
VKWSYHTLCLMEPHGVDITALARKPGPHRREVRSVTNRKRVHNACMRLQEHTKRRWERYTEDYNLAGVIELI